MRAAAKRVIAAVVLGTAIGVASFGVGPTMAAYAVTGKGCLELS